MKKFCLITLSLLACVGTVHGDHTMRTECKLESEIAIVGKPLRIEVTATNQSEKDVMLPPYISIVGPKGAPKCAKEMLPENKPTMGESIRFFKGNMPFLQMQTATRVRVDPPFEDRVAPKESKVYVFFWTPSAKDIGRGYLYIELPEEHYEPVKRIPLTVADQPAAKSADKTPVKDQPSTATPKGGSR